MTAFSDLGVLVLGLGDSGLAMARWCARRGARVQVWDSRDAPPQAAALGETLPGVALHGGTIDAARLPTLLAGVGLVLKSPGLAPSDPRIAGLLDAARERGIAVAGELELFLQALAALRAERDYAPRLLAITGTNGKTTTTAMTALLVARAGKRVATAGNIGPTLLDTLGAALDREAAAEPEPLPEVWVLELSSFQLDALSPGAAAGVEFDAAAVLNLTQDHLDWHGTMASYAAAKARIFGAGAERRTVMVVNRDDPLVEAMVPAAPEAAEPARSARVRGPRGRVPAVVLRPVLRFGLDAPRHPGDFGLVVENGMAWLVRALPAEPSERPGRRVAADEAPGIHLQRLMPADALRVRGRHNAANALAALALATAIDCPLAPMLHGLREYTGEAHRVAFVAAIGGVEAFDDSKGTNVGATVAAVLGLGQDRAPGRLLLILGGDGKGQDFAPLAAPVARHARAVALIGRDAPRIAEALADALAAGGVVHCAFDTLPAAVDWCFAQAHSGDAVLLSPACASFDMFRDYGHRAEVFVAAVQAHALSVGEALA